MGRPSLRERKQMEKGEKKDAEKIKSGKTPKDKAATGRSGSGLADGSQAIPPPAWPADKLAVSTVVVTPLKKDIILAQSIARCSPKAGKAAGKTVYSLSEKDDLLRAKPATGAKSSSPEDHRADSSPRLAFPEAVCKNRRQSARSFSAITDASFKFPESLDESEKYEDLALSGMKFMSSVNKCISTYEASVRGLRKRNEENSRSVRRKLDELEASSSRRVSSLEQELSSLRAESAEMVQFKTRQGVKDARHAKEVQSLKDQLAKAKASRQSKAQRSYADGRKASVDKFRGFLTELRETLGLLSEARTQEVDLAQVNSNLELVALLQGAEPPDLDEEKTKLSEWKDDLSGAEARFDEVIARIRGRIDSQLVPFSGSDTAPGPESGSVEKEATSLGVDDLSGSNESVPGISDIVIDKAFGPDS